MGIMFASYPSLRDQTVCITGGATGIGASFVRLFAAQGARVAFLDIDADAGSSLTELLSNEQIVPKYINCDVRNTDHLQSAIDDVNRDVGPISILINNASNDERHSSTITSEYWDNSMAVNLRHFFFASQAVYPLMKAAKAGSIINLGSVTWLLGMPSLPAYSTAKAAIHGLTRTLAREFGKDGIRVNEICPGAVWTEKQRIHGFDENQLHDFIKEKQSLQHVIQPDDVGRMALFLASDDSAMCTGQQFIVDGGWV